MMNCKEASRLISDAQDRALSFRERMALRLHLLMCRKCTRYREQLLIIRDLVASCLEETEPNDERLSDERRAVIQEKIKTAQEPSAAAMKNH